MDPKPNVNSDKHPRTRPN